MALKGIIVNGVTYQMDYNYLANKPTIPSVVVSSVSLGTSWTESGSTFSQTVTLSGVTSKTKVDLQPSSGVLGQMLADGVTAIWAENDSGTVTVYTLGATPTISLTIQCTLTETE